LKLGISGGSSAKSVAASIKPSASALRAKSSTATKTDPVNQQLSKSQRVLLRVRANIHVAVKGKPTTLQASTVSVNPQGALVLLKEALPAETRLVLEHSSTREKIACRVARAAKEMPEGFHVPVEFDSPSPGFWKIDFPPVDWRPEET
jgi:hypothetical protein